MKKRLVKKFALISTSHYEFGESKSFHVLLDGLSEEQVLSIQAGYDEYYRLWNECYEKERQYAALRISEDLRTPLNAYIDTTYFGDFNIRTCQKLWSEKELVIEHFTTENLVD